MTPPIKKNPPICAPESVHASILHEPTHRTHARQEFLPTTRAKSYSDLYCTSTLASPHFIYAIQIPKAPGAKPSSCLHPPRGPRNLLCESDNHMEGILRFCLFFPMRCIFVYGLLDRGVRSGADRIVVGSFVWSQVRRVGLVLLEEHAPQRATF